MGRSELMISGEISIKPVLDAPIIACGSIVIALMGPTGAGKSSFVEALAGRSQNFKLASNQLDSFTQSVTAYKISTSTRPIYLVDTPGFADTTKSAKEITDMIAAWMETNRIWAFSCILFLTPITDPRLAGSKKKPIEMLLKLLQYNLSMGQPIEFITTMWNTLHTDEAKYHAEERLDQLFDYLGQRYDAPPTRILRESRFDNSRDSVFRILNNLLREHRESDSMFKGVVVRTFRQKIPQQYQDLYERIDTAINARKNLESDLSLPETRNILELKNILIGNLRDNTTILTKFLAQLHDFGTPPTGWEDPSKRLHRRIMATPISDDAFAGDDAADAPEQTLPPVARFEVTPSLLNGAWILLFIIATYFALSTPQWLHLW
ncbi:P-loop containing nucleoside triphosphate hydrolase protein [Panaeolus papilionaceus]|nr:P-loop containing nucleoside triphosphate hydrolase protein [Panaeolus papilionaceus]